MQPTVIQIFSLHVHLFLNCSYMIRSSQPSSGRALKSQQEGPRGFFLIFN